MIGVSTRNSRTRTRSAPVGASASRSELHRMVNTIFKNSGNREYSYEYDESIAATTIAEIEYINSKPLPEWVSQWLCGVGTATYTVVKHEPQLLVLRVTHGTETVLLKCCKYNVVTGPVQGNERCITHEAFMGMILGQLATTNGINNIAPEVLGYGTIGGSPVLQRYGMVRAMVMATEWLEGYIDMAEWLRTCSDSEVFTSVITVLLRRLYCYYKQWRLTHYDLHYRNVMIHPQTCDVKLIDWEAGYIQLTADDVPPGLVGNHGIAHPHQGYHDRGYWVHDVFKILANCLHAFTGIVKHINSDKLLDVPRTLKLSQLWQIPIPKIVIELPHGTRSDFTSDDYYLQYLAEVSEAAQRIKVVLDQMKQREEHYITCCSKVALLLVKLIHTMGDNTINTINIFSWMDSVSRNNKYFSCGYNSVMASESVMKAFVWQ